MVGDVPGWHSRTDGPRKSRGGLAEGPVGNLHINTRSSLEAGSQAGKYTKRN